MRPIVEKNIYKWKNYVKAMNRKICKLEELKFDKRMVSRPLTPTDKAIWNYYEFKSSKLRRLISNK